MFRLADRLNKTPEEVRQGFTLEDYRYFPAYLRILEQEKQT